MTFNRPRFPAACFGLTVQGLQCNPARAKGSGRTARNRPGSRPPEGAATFCSSDLTLTVGRYLLATVRWSVLCDMVFFRKNAQSIFWPGNLLRSRKA